MDKKMQKINYKILIITSIVCLLPVLIGLYYYNSLPEMVAIHFDVNNNPNGYFTKNAFVFGMPLMMVAFQAVMCVISDISDKNKEANKKAVTAYKWLLPILTVVLYIVTVMIALENNVDVRKIVLIVVGLMFIICGNYIPKVKNNNALGLKNMKFANDKIERKYQRIVGYIMMIDGLLAMISILFNPYVSLALIILIVIQFVIITIIAIIENNKVLKNNNK